MKLFGERDRCLFCSAMMSVSPEELIGQCRCPRCSAELGFLFLPKAGTRYFVRRQNQSVIESLREPLGDDVVAVLVILQGYRRVDADSLDVLELLNELEEYLINSDDDLIQH